MKRAALVSKFSQVVGVTKAESIVTEAEAVLGFENRGRYTATETRDLCEEIALAYDGYIGDIATELQVHTQAQQRFETLLENVPDPAVVVTFADGQPVVDTVNREFETVFGYSKADSHGERLETLIVPDDDEYEMEMWAAEGGTAREVTRITADGTARTFLLRTAMETTMGGGVEGYGIYTDITERINRERDLQMLKQLFSRVFRHNIRNELSVVTGHLAIVAERVTDQSLAESATTALSAAERLLSHTEKARDIEQLVDTTPTMVTVSVEELVTNAIDRQGTLPADVSIQTDLPTCSVRVVEGFPAAIHNAIENAISHNPPPLTIDITAPVDDEGVTLRIEDDGTGISPTETEMLTSGEETPLSHGSGVGLWVMNWYAEKSGGELSITGRPDGTTVTLSLMQA